MAKDAPQLSKRSFPFRFLAGRPDRLGLSIEPTALVADGKSNARLNLTITDKGGNPLPGLSPRIWCESGSLTEVKDLGGGAFEAVYTAPARRAGEVVCHAALDMGDQPALKIQTHLTLSLPVPASLKVSCDRETLLLDGRSRANVEVRVADARGDPLEGVSVRTSVPLGSLGSVIEDGSGRYHLVYTAPKGTTATRVLIALSAGVEGGPQAQVVLNLEPVPIPPPEAPWLTIGASGAFTTNFSRLLYGGLHVDAALKMPFLRNALFVGLESGYRAGEQTDSTNVAGLEVTTRIEVIPLHAWALVRLMPHSVISPLFGMGGGADFVVWSVKATGGQHERGYRLTWSVAAGAGVDYRLGPGALSLWLRYHYAYLSAEGAIAQQSAGAASLLKGSVGGLETSLGYALFF
jgi:hypothetical protein